MAEPTKDLKTEQPDDAQQLAEAIDKGEQKAPSVNVDADLAKAKAYSVSDIDRSQEGAQAAEAVTAPQLATPGPVEINQPAEDASGDPDKFRSMAREVNPRISE